MLDAIEALERHVATSPVVITAGAGASFQVTYRAAHGGHKRGDKRLDRRCYPL